MRHRTIGVLAAAVLAVGLAATIKAMAAPSMSSAWLGITVDQDECVKKASAAVKKNSFNANFEVLGNSSIYGERGDYTALARCAADKNIVFFVVSGPKGALCSKHMNAIRDDF
jgi:hypothetical protein